MIEVFLNQRRLDARKMERQIPVSELEYLAGKRQHRGLASRMKYSERPCIIAEMKKASPSAGLLSEDYNPEKIARAYEASGAVAVSVLTEPRHFLGDVEHVRRVRKAVRLPILRKDFICDSYLVYESAACGADIILLIVKALDPALLTDLYHLAISLGLEVLIESHSIRELEIALGHRDALLRINNRNLETLETDLGVGAELAGHIPQGRLAVVESGIKTRAEIDRFWELGYKGFLIGEVLMRNKRTDFLLDELTGTKPQERTKGYKMRRP